jgi:hypothetical protein
VPYLYGGNKKAPLKLRESANTNFLLARDNQMKIHEVHPRNYPGCPPFQERAKRKRQPSSGEVTRALLLTFLLGRLAPTLVAAFCKAPTPDFRYLEHWSNHSATVAVQGSLFRELRDYIMGRVRCIRPKSDVVSLGRKKASKKLVKKSKVNGKCHITVTGSKKCAKVMTQ